MAGHLQHDRRDHFFPMVFLIFDELQLIDAVKPLRRLRHSLKKIHSYYIFLSLSVYLHLRLSFPALRLFLSGAPGVSFSLKCFLISTYNTQPGLN